MDGELINLVQSMGATGRQIFAKIKFPSALPYFFSGLKIAATYSIMGAVIGEWLGGKAGLGVYMLRARHAFALDLVCIDTGHCDLIDCVILRHCRDSKGL